MIKALKFVKGAVSKKNFVPILSHYKIEKNKVYGYNGNLALCSPIALDLDIVPDAISFFKAIETCQETISAHLTKTGRLALKSGAFKAFIDCAEEEFPSVEIEGDIVKLPCPILPAIKKLAPLISEDASRPWSQGILFKGQSIFATNNIVYCEHYLGVDFPIEMNVPKFAINELIRINEEPIHIQISDTALVFHFEGDRWLRTLLYDVTWPDLSEVWNQENNPVPICEEFFTQVEKLVPFVDELQRIFVGDNEIMTHQQDEGGASIDVKMLHSVHETVYVCLNIKYLLTLKPLADKIDFSIYPMPIHFQGEMIRGVISGLRY